MTTDTSPDANSTDISAAPPAPPTNASPELEDMVRSIHAIGERGTGRDDEDARGEEPRE